MVSMGELNPSHVEAVIRMINRSPYFQLLGMNLKKLGCGTALVEIDIDRKHLNPYGGLHGGVYASVIDTAAYWAVYCELDEGVGLISIDLKVDFLAPVSAGKMFIEGRRIKIGKTMCLAEATAFASQDKCLAHGVSKMMVTQGLQTIHGAAALAKDEHLPPKFLITEF
jgi:uncharacterized protein (TIGR00369 family)